MSSNFYGKDCASGQNSSATSGGIILRENITGEWFRNWYTVHGICAQK